MAFFKIPSKLECELRIRPWKGLILTFPYLLRVRSLGVVFTGTKRRQPVLEHCTVGGEPPRVPHPTPPEPPQTSRSLSEHPRASATRCPGGSTARRPGMPREQKAKNSPPKLGELGSPLNRRAPGAHLHALPQVNHAGPRRQDDLHSAAVFPSQAT